MVLCILPSPLSTLADEIFRTSQEQEICGRPAPRAVDDLHSAGLEGFLKIIQNGFGAIGRSVVGCYQSPIPKGLPFERSQLLDQETLAVERAKKNCNGTPVVGDPTTSPSKRYVTARWRR
jgi:hypothetical protein